MADFIDLIGDIDSISDVDGIFNSAQYVDLTESIDSISNVIANINTSQYYNILGIINSMSQVAGALQHEMAPETSFLGSVLYNETLNSFLSGRVNFETATCKLMLLNKLYEPKSSHNFADIINSCTEVTGEGYMTGGKIISGLRIEDGILWADNVYWKNATFDSVRYAVLYIDNGSVPTNQALAVFDFGSSRSIEASIFAVLWGIANSTYGSIMQLIPKKTPNSQNFITA